MCRASVIEGVRIDDGRGRLGVRDGLIVAIAAIVADGLERSRGSWKSKRPLRVGNSCYKIKVVSRKRVGDRSDGRAFGTGSRGTSVTEAFD